GVLDAVQHQREPGAAPGDRVETRVPEWRGNGDRPLVAGTPGYPIQSGPICLDRHHAAPAPLGQQLAPAPAVTDQETLYGGAAAQELEDAIGAGHHERTVGCSSLPHWLEAITFPPPRWGRSSTAIYSVRSSRRSCSGSASSPSSS